MLAVLEQSTEYETVQAQIIAIRQGLPVSRIDSIATTLQLSKQAVADILGVSTRSIQRKQLTPDGTLTPKQSEHAIAIEKLIYDANQYFKSPEKTQLWFNTTLLVLNHCKPIDLLDTITGITLLSDELNKLKYGMLA